MQEALVDVEALSAEGNLLEPLILSPVLQLHPFTVILAVTAGAVTSGVVGAFLAVPMAAILARVVDYLRGRRPAAGPGSKPDDDTPAWGDEADPASDDSPEQSDCSTGGPATTQPIGAIGGPSKARSGFEVTRWRLVRPPAENRPSPSTVHRA